MDADHAIDLLAREHDLLSADDSELLLQIAPLLARLEREAPIRDALADLDGDSDALVAEYRANEAASIQALLRSAEEWEARHPAVRVAANKARIELLKTLADPTSRSTRGEPGPPPRIALRFSVAASGRTDFGSLDDDRCGRY